MTLYNMENYQVTSEPSYPKLIKVKIPNTVYEALKDPAWRVATHDEFRALEQNGTWEITYLPPEKQTVGCRWLFSVKHQAMEQSKDSKQG